MQAVSTFSIIITFTEIPESVRDYLTLLVFHLTESICCDSVIG